MSRLELLRDRRLLALLVAETVSTTGAQMTWLALPWFVLTTTGSAGKMTLVLASEALGLLLMGIPGGTILTRLGARRTMMLCDAGRLPLTLLVPLLHWRGALSFPLLLVLVFGLGALTGPYFAAQRSIVPELVGEDERIVGKANAFLQTAQRITLLLGPATAGFLIAWLGAPWVIVIDASTYLVSLTLVGLFVRAEPAVELVPGDRGRLLDGFRFLVRDPSCAAGRSRSLPATRLGRRSSRRCQCSSSPTTAPTRGSPAGSLRPSASGL